jgi:hypothetical protein
MTPCAREDELPVSKQPGSIMFGLNTYFSAANARDYMDQLFSRTGASSVSESRPTAWTVPSYDPTTGTTAQDRALSKIISILWDREHGGEEDQSSVSNVNGYILDASGTDEADTINMQAISAYNVASGDGDDTVNIKAGSLAALDGGAGNDKLSIAADYAGAVDGGDGDDTIGFAGKIADAISGGSGNDTLKISARAILDAQGGDGDDNLYLEGERIFAAGGGGNDTITINNKSGQPSQLSFAIGDGEDTVGTNGPLDIRFTASSSGLGAYAPEDLDVSAYNGKLMIRALNADDAITINFDAGALEGAKPSFSFEMQNGDYVLKIR